MADASTQAALLALETLTTIVTNSAIRDRIDLAERRLRALRRVLGMITQGAPQSQILAAIEADLSGGVDDSAEELLKAALNGLELDAGLLATVGATIRCFGIAHPGRWRWSTPCRRNHVATTVLLNATTQPLRQALLHTRVSSRAITMALQYPHGSAERNGLVAAAGELARHATDYAQATLQQWNLMRLAAKTQFGSATRLFAIGGA